MLKLNKLSTENLKRLKEFLEICIDELELQNIKIRGYKIGLIPRKRFYEKKLDNFIIGSILEMLAEMEIIQPLAKKHYFELAVTVLLELKEEEKFPIERAEKITFQEFSRAHQKFIQEAIKNNILKTKLLKTKEFLERNFLLLGTRDFKRVKKFKKGIETELMKREGRVIKKQKELKTNLFLTPNGELYREPKNKYCYSMDEKSKRYKIIHFLATNKGYQSTQSILIESGIKNEKTLRNEIRKIREKVTKYLKIKGKDFLEGKAGSGYRINPKYKITILKNE